MKNVLRMSILVVFLLTGVNVKASESFGVRVMDKQNLLVELERVEEGTVLLLQDKNGEILFRDSIMSKESYKKILNLEVIPSGTYFLSLEKENRILSTVLVKNSAGVEIKEEVSGIIFKPAYKVEDGKVRFFLSNPEKNNIQVTVYDENGVEIGSSSSSKAVIRKTFDFSNVPAGNYIMQVKTKDRNFSRKLTVS